MQYNHLVPEAATIMPIRAKSSSKLIFMVEIELYDIEDFVLR